jgi:crossover junction endodeoxyribonuclease RusA
MRAARVQITVPGVPVPLARHRSGRHGTYLPKRSRDYRTLIQTTWMEAGRQTLGAAPFACSLRFYGANARADLDNLCKGVLDALNTLAFEDDRQLVCIAGAHKLPADEHGPRAEIDLWRAECAPSMQRTEQR